MLGSQTRPEALKNRNRSAYSEFLADDFMALEADDRGTPNNKTAGSEVDIHAMEDYTRRTLVRFCSPV
jgi:hypothetical protein